MKRAHIAVLGLILAYSLALAPERAAAQTDLASSEAQEFMGNWLVTIQGEQGETLVELGIEDEEGVVAGSVTMIGLGTQAVTDISKEEDTLQFQLMADAQGQLIPILVRLTPNGEELAVFIELGDGQFSAEGVGTRMAN